MTTKIDKEKNDIKAAERLLKKHNYTVIRKGFLKCNICGKIKSVKETNYFSSSSYMFQNATASYKPYNEEEKIQAFVPVCKTCLAGLIDTDKPKNVLNVLRIMDKPYIKSDWDSIVKQYKNKVKDITLLGYYVRNISLNYKGKGFSDSDLYAYTAESLKKDKPKDVKLTKRSKKKSIEEWGNGFTDEVYDFLNSEMLKLTTSFECPDYGMTMIMKDISWINKDIKEAKKANKDISKLVKIRSSLMSDAKMNPISSTGADENEKVTFGTLIQKYENNKPIPQDLDDDMKKYINLYMVGHLGKMQGLDNKMTQDYEKALEEFTINFEDLEAAKEEDEEDDQL